MKESRTIVINYHITERCNFACSFCFGKWDLADRFKEEIHHSQLQVQKLLGEIYHHFHNELDYDIVRLNIAGGEPLLLKQLPEILRMANNIGFEVSLITNGYLFDDRRIENLVPNLAMVGISLDSFSHATNLETGRCSGGAKTLSFEQAEQIINAIRKVSPSTQLKINTVLTKHNHAEVMATEVNRLSPDKWKIFQVLGSSDNAVTKQQYEAYIMRNVQEATIPVFPEDNDEMTESYLMIDPLGRFYQNRPNFAGYDYSDSILSVGVKAALEQNRFSEQKIS